ncbi:MAG: response regulator [Proteobacteria bacterium]|nr:response regulator [Pseudomonadota bacterium]
MSDTLDPHILVVDDDPLVVELLQDYLGANELRVSAASNGTQMWQAFEREAIDLVLLDVRLPGENGMRLAAQLREKAPVPIILLTGRAEEADRVMGLEVGADDYIVKPFSSRELLARVRAQLRRSRMLEASPRNEDRRRAFRFAGWELNLRTRRLRRADGGDVELSNGQFSLLVALCGAGGRVLSRDQLLGQSRLHGAEVYDRNIDVQILRLRRQIEPDPARPSLIVTERGAGYRFAPAVETLY